MKSGFNSLVHLQIDKRHILTEIRCRTTIKMCLLSHNFPGLSGEG